jgi:hypothetical protein
MTRATCRFQPSPGAPEAHGGRPSLRAVYFGKSTGWNTDERAEWPEAEAEAMAEEDGTDGDVDTIPEDFVPLATSPAYEAAEAALKQRGVQVFHACDGGCEFQQRTERRWIGRAGDAMWLGPAGVIAPPSREV